MMGAGFMGGGGLAETARLVTELDLKDDLSGGLEHAQRATAGYVQTANQAGAAADRVSAKGGGMSRAMHGIGNAAAHARGRVSGLANILGAGGLLGGILGVVAYSKKAIDSAEAWGESTRRINQITRMGVEESSRFVDAFDKFGIAADKQERILGFMTKTMGNYGTNAAAAKKVQEDFGFSVLNSNGKVKSAQQVLLDFTDYFNRKGIPATQKAALAAKLFGRGWTDMLPIFELGSRKVKKGMDDAMTMTQGQFKMMTKWRDTQREFNDVIGDLGVKVGLILIPTLMDFAKGITSFVEENEGAVLGFFRDLGNMAKDTAGFLTGTVLPTVKGLADAVLGFWNSIPGPLRDLLVTGFIANKAVKFMFGVSGLDIGKSILGALTGGGGLFARGSSPANAMWVKPVGGMGGGMGPGGAAVAGGRGIGMLGRGILAVEVVAMAAAVWDAWQTNIAQPVAENQKKLAEQAEGLKGNTRDEALKNLTNMARLMLDESNAAQKAVIQTTSSKELGAALTNASKVLLSQTTRSEDIPAALEKMARAQKAATEYGWTAVADQIGQDMKDLQEGKGGKGEVGTATRTAREVGRAVDRALRAMPKTMGDSADRIGQRLGRTLGHLQQAADRPGQREFARGLRAIEREVRKGWTGDEKNSEHLRKAIQMAERLQSRAVREGHRGLARNLGKDIDRMKTAMSIAQKDANRTLDQIAAQPTEVNVKTTVNTNISVRESETASRTATRYGMTAV